MAAMEGLATEDMHWSMDIISMRCAEKLLDVLAGERATGGRALGLVRLARAACW